MWVWSYRTVESVAKLVVAGKMVGLKGRDLLSLGEFSSKEVDLVLKTSLMLARQRTHRPTLLGKTVAMIFQKPSTRTRASLEAAVNQLGGHGMYLSWNEMQLGRGETVADTARVLDRYVDVIAARVFAHATLQELAQFAKAPVINLLSDSYHPCQTLADLLTILQYKRRLRGSKLAYVGDGNNVCNSLMIGCAKTGVSVSIASPEGYRPAAEAARIAREAAADTGATVEIAGDPEAAVKGSDAVYTDTFVSMGMENEKEERLKAFLPKYQVNSSLFSLAKPDAVFMHCLPAHRGEEVTGDVLDGPRSAVWDQAENRLHTAKALLNLIL